MSVCTCDITALHERWGPQNYVQIYTNSTKDRVYHSIVKYSFSVADVGGYVKQG